MAVNLIVTEQKFFNQFKNGEDFSLNTGDFTNNLTGSVMEKVKVIQSLDVSWGINYLPAQFDWTITTSGTIMTIVSNDGYDFNNEGFSAGDIVDIRIVAASLPLIFNNCTVNIVSGNTIIIDVNIVFSIVGDITQTIIIGKSDLTSLEYRFGLVENSENYNIISKVSDNDQGYYSESIGIDSGGGRSTSFVNLQRLGTYADWQTGSCRARFVSNPTIYSQRFEIEHEFIIVPYYLDGQISNLNDNIIPTLLNGTNSLKYVFESGHRSALSNPNTEKSEIFDLSLGSVGWFNERFNGYNNDYNIKSISYEETPSGNTVDGLLISGTTRTTITVEKLNGVFNATNRYGVFISYLPDQPEYQDTISNQVENFIYDNVHNNVLSPSASGQDFITSTTASIVSGDLVIEVDTLYSNAQQAFLSTKNASDPVKYVIGVQVGDENISSASSDRVMLIGDSNFYDESPDIPGLIVNPEFEFFPYPKVVGVDTGFTDLITWNEDGFTLSGSFGLNLNQDAFINSIEVDLLSHNALTNQFFSLDSFTFNIGNPIVVGGVQQINVSDTRGYNLESGSQFNEISITLGPLVAGIQTYNYRFSQKMSWQDWIANNLVDSVFYDASQPNNNLNDKSSNYSGLNNYEIKTGVKINVSGTSLLGVSGVTDYVLISSPLKVFNYDEDGNLTPVWSATIETFNPTTSTNLNGAVIVGANTLFRTTFVNSTGPVSSLSGITTIHRIEETNQNGYDIDELGTLYSYPSGNRVIPKTGLTNLEMNIVSGNVVTECLIDGSQISSGTGYNLSSKLENGTAIITDGKIEEGGAIKIEEGGLTKFIE